MLSQVDRQVAVLDRGTGHVVWRRRVGQNIGAGPLVDRDRVLVGTQTGDGEVIALDLATGRRLWDRRLGDIAAPLAVDNAQVYAATVGGRVAAYSSAAGERGWHADVHGGVRAAPVVVAGGLVVATDVDSLYLLDRNSGVVRERRGTAGAVLAAPALADSLLVFGTAAGRLEACDTTSLATRWTLDVGSEVVGAVAVQRDTVFVITHDGTLWWVPLRAPDSAVHLAVGAVARAGPTPVAGGVLVADVTGRLSLVTSAGGGGSPRWTVTIHPPLAEPPVVEGSFFVLVSERGEVEAFR